MSLNAAGSSTYPITSCRKENQFWNVYVQKIWDDGQCPKISVKKSVIHHGL